MSILALSESGAENNLVWIETSLLVKCKHVLMHMNGSEVYSEASLRQPSFNSKARLLSI